MRLAIINSVFDYGSTGSLARQLYEYGKSCGIETYAFYGRGKEYDDNHIIRIDYPIEVYIHKGMSLLFGNQGYYSFRATRSLIKKIKKLKITHFILLNLHGYYLNEPNFWKCLHDENIKVVYVTPDEYAGLGKCAFCLECTKYQTECKECPRVKVYPKSFFLDKSNVIFEMKKRAYSGIKSMTVMGPETNLQVFRKSALLQGKRLQLLDWGIDLDTYHYSYDESIYEKYSIPRDKIIVLTAAKYSNERKGVKKYFFELAKTMTETDFHFINVGYDGNLSVEEIPRNMTVIPYIGEQDELAKVYSLSDIYLLPSTTDTMPLSCLISFACETPVLCFNTSGLVNLDPDHIGVVEYVEDISVTGLKKALMKYKKKDEGIRSKCRKYAEDRFSKETFNKKVFSAFEE